MAATAPDPGGGGLPKPPGAPRVPPILRDSTGKPVPGVVSRGTTTPPPVGGPPAPPGDGNPFNTPPPVDTRTAPQPGQFSLPAGSFNGQPGRSMNGGPAAGAVAQQTAQSNVTGATPFMQTPGMQIASQRVSGQDVQNDPAISAAMQDFQRRIAPGLQDSANTMGLGRSTAALNSLSEAQGQMLAPMYESSFGREQTRLNNMGTASENELQRQQRSAEDVSSANQNQAQLLMQMAQNQYQNGQTTGQNAMQAGGTMRDITQQGNTANLNDFLRQQALGEQAVYAPFGGLAGGGLGSMTSSTGK
jgi:hypothetical protein